MIKQIQIDTITGPNNTLTEILATSRRALARLKGSTTETQRSVGYIYVAPNHEAAAALTAQLKGKGDHVVMIPTDEPNESYAVIGRSQTLTLSDDVFDQWVTNMINRGQSHGCKFAGWGFSELIPLD